MRLTAFLIFLATALPASALAQTTTPPPAPPAEGASSGKKIVPGARLKSPAMRKKQAANMSAWSLDKAGKKPQGKMQQSARSEVQGPALPAEPKVRLPRQRTAKAPPREKKLRVNAAPLVSTIIRNKEKN
jgi:hypothetical protein